MEKKEAVILTGRILARYPAGRNDDAIIAAWAEEMSQRFATLPETQVREIALAYCRQNPSRWPPGLDEICDWIAGRLRAEQPKRLPEPPIGTDEIRRNKARLAELMGRLI